MTMTPTTGHVLTLMDVGGRRIEARVTYLQPGVSWHPGQRAKKTQEQKKIAK